MGMLANAGAVEVFGLSGADRVVLFAALVRLYPVRSSAAPSDNFYTLTLRGE